MSEKEPLYESPGEKGKRGFEDLECYKLSLEVMAKIHTFSKTLPPYEKYDLYAQIRRSSKGVTGNIGEAYGRYHYLDSLHYYSIARGELNETLVSWRMSADSAPDHRNTVIKRFTKIKRIMIFRWIKKISKNK